MYVYCHIKFLCAYLRFGFLRLSTTKKYPHINNYKYQCIRLEGKMMIA